MIQFYAVYKANIHGVLLSNKKEWTSETSNIFSRSQLCWMKNVNSNRLHIVWFYLYNTSKMTVIMMDYRWVAAWSQGDEGRSATIRWQSWEFYVVIKLLYVLLVVVTESAHVIIQHGAVHTHRTNVNFPILTLNSIHI